MDHFREMKESQVSCGDYSCQRTFAKISVPGDGEGLSRAETMVCFNAFSLKADQMPIFGLLLVFFFVEKSTF